MIFASDLDRTLIYSSRAMEELRIPQNTKVIPVEKRNGSWVAFMTESALTHLKKLSSSCLFIPVTTRTTEQFNRIVIFPETIPLPYAITTNGAVILHNGKPMDEWTEYISTLIKEESASLSQMLRLLDKEGFRFQGQLRQVENLFFYYVLNDLPSNQEKNMIQAIVGTCGWRISLQGRKLYFIPKAISKGAALEFLCRQLGVKAFAGAGDSILDWDFLRNCHHRFVPSHGELKRDASESSITYTKKVGIEAGEEILLHCLNLLPNPLTISEHTINNKTIQAAK